MPLEDAAEFDRVAATLPVVADREALARELIAASYWLCFDLYELRRANPKAVVARLDDLLDKLEAALVAFEELAPRALDAMARSAEKSGSGKPGTFLRTASSEEVSPLDGRAWTAIVVRALEELALWMHEARVAVPVPRVFVEEVYDYDVDETEDSDGERASDSPVPAPPPRPARRLGYGREVRLDRLLRRLEAVPAALAGLGHDASEALHIRAAKDSVHPGSEGGVRPWRSISGRSVPATGRERVTWMVRLFEECVLVGQQAVVDVPRSRRMAKAPGRPAESPEQLGSQPTPVSNTSGSGVIVRKPGRPRMPEGVAIMQSLAQLWEQHTGKKPTVGTSLDPLSMPPTTKKHGPFLDFASAVIEPIYRSLGSKPPDVPSLAQKVLYPPREKGEEDDL